LQFKTAGTDACALLMVYARQVLVFLVPGTPYKASIFLSTPYPELAHVRDPLSITHDKFNEEYLRIMKVLCFIMVEQPLSGPRPPRYRGFMIILRHTTFGRTPLDEWSGRRRDLYLTTHNTHTARTTVKILISQS